MTVHYTQQAADLAATGNELAQRFAHALEMGEGYIVTILSPTGLEVHAVSAKSVDVTVDMRRLVRAIVRDLKQGAGSQR